jgi:hypothetical protein
LADGLFGGAYRVEEFLCVAIDFVENGVIKFLSLFEVEIDQLIHKAELAIAEFYDPHVLAGLTLFV